MPAGEVEQSLNIPNNYRVGIKVTIRSACTQRASLWINDSLYGNWEGSGGKELHNGSSGANGLGVKFRVKIEHNCKVFAPYADKWEPNDVLAHFVPIAGGYVWQVVSEDGRNKSYDDTIINVFVHRSNMMPEAADTELVDSMLT